MSVSRLAQKHEAHVELHHETEILERAPSGAVDPNSESGCVHKAGGVSFGQFTIREYSRCLGNNPAVTHGAPLSLDWSYSLVGTYHLETYEKNRRPRLVGEEMMLSGQAREKILLEHTDVTHQQLKSMIADVMSARRGRQACYALQEFEIYHLVFESIIRKFKRLKTGVSRKREFQMLWENARRLAIKKQAQEKSELEESSTDDSSVQYSLDY